MNIYHEIVHDGELMKLLLTIFISLQASVALATDGILGGVRSSVRDYNDSSSGGEYVRDDATSEAATDSASANVVVSEGLCNDYRGNSFTLPYELVNEFAVGERFTLDYNKDNGVVRTSNFLYGSCFENNIDLRARQVGDQVYVYFEPFLGAGSSSESTISGYGKKARMARFFQCVSDIQSMPGETEAQIAAKERKINEVHRFSIDLDAARPNIQQSGEIFYGFLGSSNAFERAVTTDAGELELDFKESNYVAQEGANSCINLRPLPFSGRPRYLTENDRVLRSAKDVCESGVASDILTEMNRQNSDDVNAVLSEAAISSVAQHLEEYSNAIKTIGENPDVIQGLTKAGQYTDLFENIRRLLVGDDGASGLLKRRVDIRKEIQELAKQNASEYSQRLALLREEEGKIDNFLELVVKKFGDGGESVVNNLIVNQAFEDAEQAKNNYYLVRYLMRGLSSPSNTNITLGSIVAGANQSTERWKQSVIAPRVAQARAESTFNSIKSNVAEFGPDANFQSNGLRQQLQMGQVGVQRSYRDLQRKQYGYQQNLVEICNDNIGSKWFNISGVRSFTPGQRQRRYERCGSYQREISQLNRQDQMNIRNQQLGLNRLERYYQFVSGAEQQGWQEYMQNQPQQDPFSLNPSDRLFSPTMGAEQFYQQFGNQQDPFMLYNQPFGMADQMSGMPYSSNGYFSRGLNTVPSSGVPFDPSLGGAGTVYAPSFPASPIENSVRYGNPSFFQSAGLPAGASRGPAVVPSTQPAIPAGYYQR